MNAHAPSAVLVVGAGAVGRVFAHHLERSGAEVTLCVRDPAKTSASATLRQLGLFARREPAHSVADAVLSRADELCARSFDEVYLTVPSDALAGDWMRSIAPGFGDATVIALQTGIEIDRRLAELGVAAERLVRGLIGFMSYASPLGSATPSPEPSFEYWSPRLSPCAFEGPREAVDAVVRRLRRGGLPARRGRDVATGLAFFTAVLLVHLRALELQGWSLDRYRPRVSNAEEATRQAFAVTSRALGASVPWPFALAAQRAPVGTALRLARWFVPFPLEDYIRVHFTKVAPQTILFLNEIAEHGRSAGLAVDAVERLIDGGAR